MEILKKLPESKRQPPGLEWRILKKLPAVLLTGTLLPLVICLLIRLFPPKSMAVEIAKHTSTFDIVSIALVATLWMAAFTVAIGCVVVMIMKGPAYVADAYELPDSDQPWKH